MRTVRFEDAAGLGFLGFLYGAVVGLLAYLFAGAGHGWCSAGVTAWGAWPLAIFGVAQAFRGRPTGRILLAVAIVWIADIDARLIDQALAEDLNYLRRVWRSRLGFALWWLWLLMWIGCQVRIVWAVVAEVWGCRKVARSAWSELE